MKAISAIAAASLLLSACTQDPADDGTEETGTSEFGDIEDIDAVTQAPPLPAFGADQRPVRIGLDGPDFDACGGNGEITGLNPDGDNYLSVRAAPDADAIELDTLTSGTGASMCETADGWIGIVYAAPGMAGADCGVGSPVADARDYGGPCRSGWVSQRYIELIVG